MRIHLDAEVCDSGDHVAGRIAGLVFDRESRRVAGFLVRTSDGVPRDVFVMPGQVELIEQDRVTLTLAREALDALPNARQHLFVEPGQDLDTELAEADSEGALADTPDPDERPRATRIPGVSLLPGMFTPIEVERDAFSEGQVPLAEGVRIIAADGQELGHLQGFVLNEAAQLEGLTLRENAELVVPFDRISQVNDDTRELILSVVNPASTTTDSAGAAGTIEP